MAVESNGVKISIEVVDKNSAAVIGGVTQNLNQLGAAGSTTGAKVAQSMNVAGASTMNAATAATSFNTRMSAAMAAYDAQAKRSAQVAEFLGAKFDEFSKNSSFVEAMERATAAAAQFTPALNNQEKQIGSFAGSFGEARILMGAMTGSTRAMAMGLANVGARLSWLAPLWEAGLGVAIGVGAVAMIGQMAVGVYDLYEKYLSLDSAIDAYNENLEKARDQEFIRPLDIETATDRLREASNQAQRLMTIGMQMHGSFWRDALGALGTSGFTGALQAGGMDLFGGTNAFSAGMKTQEQANALKQVYAQQHHQEIMDAIELSHAADARLTGEQKITAEKNKQHAIDEENRKYEAARESFQGNTVDAKAGQQHQQMLDRIADQKAAAEAYNYQRSQMEELSRLQAQADEASLTGYKLLERQREAEDQQFVLAHGANAEALAAIDRRYYAEEKKQAAEGVAELRRIQEESQMAGLTGVARMQQEGRNRVQDFLSSAHPNMNPGQILAAVNALNKETQQGIAAESENFSQRVNELVDQVTSRTLTGFAQIHAQAQRQIDELKRQAEAAGASPADLSRGVAAIRQSEADQVTDRQRRNADETAQIEAQARSRFLNSEQDKTAAIETEYEERLRKFQEELQQQEISQNDYNRRVVAAAQIRDAEMANSAREAREKMAHEFTDLFYGMDHPLKELQQLGDRFAGEAAAAMVQRVQTHYGHSGGSASGTPGGFFGGLFARMAGHPQPPQSAPREVMAHAAEGGAHSLAIGNAVIRVGSASIELAGGSTRSANGALSSVSSFPGWGTHTTNAIPVSSGGTGAVSISSAPAFTGSAGRSSTAADFTGSTSAYGGGTTGAGPVVPPSSTHAQGSMISSPAGYGAQGKGTSASTVLGNLNQGMSLFNQARSTFSQHSNSGAASASSSSAASGSGTATSQASGLAGSAKQAAGAGSTLATVAAGAQGAIGVYGAYEGNGGVGGALGGAASGMELGMAIGGPIGAAVGAAAGAIIGAIGFGGRERARVYDLKQVRPHIAQDYQAYETGGMDYLSAYSDMQSLDVQAEHATRQWGPAAHSYYNDTIRTEIAQARGRLDAMERAGRSNYSASTAQYDVGVNSVPRDGMAFIHRNERIVDAGRNERITRALEASAEAPRMAAQPAGSWSGDLHVHAIDAQGVSQFLSDNKHGIRAAVNESLAENSGGADAVY